MSDNNIDKLKSTKYYADIDDLSCHCSDIIFDIL